MSNAVFPELPGLAWSNTRTPIWRTEIQESVSGMELAWSGMVYPHTLITLKYDVLRAGHGYAELQQLVGFFNARRGRFDTFLWRDPTDYRATDQQIGSGNGAQSSFPVFREMGGFGEPVLNFITAPAVKVAGALKTQGTDYTLSNGLLTFTSAPPAGAAVTWSGQFYKRMRFQRDETEFEQFLDELWSAKKIELKTVKW